MVKVKYFRVENSNLVESSDIYEIISRTGCFQFWTTDEMIAFEEHVEDAFRKCIGEGYEVSSVGKKFE